MSLYGVMRTGVSGMNAQSNKLGTIADNVSNAGTVGYKRATADFSSFVLDAGNTNYDSGAVVTTIHHAVGQQGPLSYTSSPTDLAIQGSGFMIVQDPKGVPFITRAGAFRIDASTANLVNTSGFTLVGYPVANGGTDVVVNGTAGLQPINLSGMNLRAIPSSEGTFQVNLPSNDAVVSGNTPADNLVDSAYSEKSSVVTYDNLGNEVTLDVFMTKTAADTWQVAVFDHSDAPSSGVFPYGAAALTTQTVTFDSLGKLSSTPTMSVAVPNGQTLKFDLTGSTQLAANYSPLNIAVNGSAPSTVSGVVIEKDGTVFATYENGTRTAAFRIPLATVESPDNLEPLPGNVFATTVQSGDIQIAFPEEAGRGSLISGALEQSNVDMASELTDMIVAQRDYTANSKVVQTGSELLDVLMSLKR
jgi:flagellar hook protein FlgE